MLHIQPLGAVQRTLRIPTLGAAEPGSSATPGRDFVRRRADESAPDAPDAPDAPAFDIPSRPSGSGVPGYSQLRQGYCGEAGDAEDLCASGADYTIYRLTTAFDQPRPKITDGATGNLRAASVPAPLRPLITDITSPFQAGSGPFEGLWSCRDSSGTRFTLRLYDRDGWVVGNFNTSYAARHNIILRRSGNSARGRVYQYRPEGGDDFVPFEMTVAGDGISAQSLHTRSYRFTGTRTAGPPRPSAPRRQESRSPTDTRRGAGASAAPRPWLLYGLIGLGATAVIVGLATAGKR